MKRTLLAAAATLALALPGIATAQDSPPADATAAAYSMTDAQRGMYDGWPADRRTAYDAWPGTYQTYYWSLTPEQQAGWWVLNDEQRGRVYAMTPAQRTAAWASISQQMAAQSTATPATTQGSGTMSGQTDMATTTTTTTTTTGTMQSDTGMAASSGAMSSGNIQFVRREMVQTAEANADAAALASGDLPVCKKNQQDGCINSWEKNRTGTRPLDRWPGRPASERR